MKQRNRAGVAVFCAALCCSVAAFGQGGVSDRDSGRSVLDGAAAGYTAQLGALDPADPEAYLLLGEEILAVSRTEGDRRLARRLFTLAYEGARESGTMPGVQASACIALADTARYARDRRWLWSIVRLVDPRYVEPDWSRTVEQSVSDASAYRAATALGLLRSGNGLRAREALRDEGVRSVFDWYSGLLTGTGPGDVQASLEREAARWPCPECKNERVVNAPGGGGTRVRCFTCRGNPGWALGEAGLLATLRFESRVLSGVQRSWGAQIASDLGEPLRDPDPSAVADVVGFDTGLRVFEGGAWQAPGDEAGEHGADSDASAGAPRSSSPGGDDLDSP